MLCVCFVRMHVCVPLGFLVSQEASDIWSPRTGVAAGYGGCWESNPGLQEEQLVLFNSGVLSSPRSLPLLETTSALRTALSFEIFFSLPEKLGIRSSWCFGKRLEKPNSQFQHKWDLLALSLLWHIFKIFRFSPWVRSEVCSRHFSGVGGLVRLYIKQRVIEIDEELHGICDVFALKNVTRTTVSCRGTY